MDIEEWANKYRSEYHKYDKLTNKLKSLLEELLKQENIKATFESRTKELKSFKEKITRDGKCYTDPMEEITDFSGIRIILNSLSDVDKTADLIAREFTVDEEKSVDKSEILEPDQFGYISQHFIVKLNESRGLLTEWQDVNELWSEIQVRTVLQHAWAIISHSLDYKNESDVPSKLRRRLFRLSALFELADEDLDFLINEIGYLSRKYKEEIDSEELEMELNIDSLRVYLETSKTVEYWVDFIESLGIEVVMIGSISQDIKMLERTDIKTIAELDALLEKSKGWGEKYIEEFFINTWERSNFRNYGTTRSIIGLFLVANYLDIFTDDILEETFEWYLPKRATIPAKKYSPNYQD